MEKFLPIFLVDEIIVDKSSLFETYVLTGVKKVVLRYLGLERCSFVVVDKVVAYSGYIFD